MALRQTPESFFRTSSSTRAEAHVDTATQQPIPVQPVQSLQAPIAAVDPNVLIVLGIVALVGLIGLFALLGSERKCR